jgi:hypothetical protein
MQVKKVYKQGLFIQFLGYFGGTVSSQHLGCPLSKLSANYPEDKKVCPVLGAPVRRLPHALATI